MNISKFIKKTVLFTVLLFLFTACKNFMNSGDFLTQLEENIKIVNAPKFTVLFEMDNNGYGTLNYIGYTECYIGQILEVKFAENQTYKLDHWYFSSTDNIEVEIPEDDPTQIKIKFNANAQDLVIKPVCILRCDAIAPVFNSFIVKQPQTKPVVAGNEDRLITLTEFSQWNDIDFNNNHVCSLNFDFEIYDESGSVGQTLELIVREYCLEDINGNTKTDYADTKIKLTAADFVKDTRFPNVYTYKSNYNFALPYDGVVKMEVSCVDGIGNESSPKVFYVIKDTIVDCKIINPELKTISSTFPATMKRFEEILNETTDVFIPKIQIYDRWYKTRANSYDFDTISFSIVNNYYVGSNDFSVTKYPAQDYGYAIKNDSNFEAKNYNDNWTYLVLHLKNYNRKNCAILFEYFDDAGNEVSQTQPLLCSPDIKEIYKTQDNKLKICSTDLNPEIGNDNVTTYVEYLGYKIQNGEKFVFDPSYYSADEENFLDYEENTEYHIFEYQINNFFGKPVGLLSNEKVIKSNDIVLNNNPGSLFVEEVENYNIGDNFTLRGIELFGNDFVIKSYYKNYANNTPVYLNIYYTKNLKLLNTTEIKVLPKISYQYKKNNNSKIKIPADILYNNDYAVYFDRKIDGNKETGILHYVVPVKNVSYNNITISNTDVTFGNVYRYTSEDLKIPTNCKKSYQYFDETNNQWCYLTTNAGNGGDATEIDYEIASNVSEYQSTSSPKDKFYRVVNYHFDEIDRNGNPENRDKIYKSVPVYYFRNNSSFKCNIHNLSDHGDFVTVMADKKVYVHTIYSPRNFGNNPDDWEFYSSVNHKVNPKVLDNASLSNNYIIQDYVIDKSLINPNDEKNPYKDLPCYYVVIAHFADGKTLMSEVKTK